MLMIFSVCLAYSVSWLTSYFMKDVAYAIQASAVMAILLGLALNATAMKADGDLKVTYGLFWCGSIIVAFFCATLLFMPDEWLFTSTAAVVMIVFGMHIVWDTNRMCGRGQGKHELEITEYALCVLMLYADLPTIICDAVKNE